MNASTSRSAIAARSIRRCFLHFLLCLVALGTWSTPVPAPLAAPGEFGLLEHFLSDQAATVSQQESPRLPRTEKAESDDDADSPGPAAHLPAARPRLAGALSPASPRRRSRTARPRLPQAPRAPPDHA